MPKTNERDAFSYRVNFAARVISSGANTTRSFDNCFENYDGDAVAVAVYRRSRRNPKLRRNLWRYIGRSTVVPVAFAERRRSTRDLANWAAELRATAIARREAETLEWQAKQDALKARAIGAGYTLHELRPYWFTFKRPDGSIGSSEHHVERNVYFYACQDLDAATA